MVWESSVYPTREIVDYCREESAMLLAQNGSDAGRNSSGATTSSGSGKEVDVKMTEDLHEA